MDWLFTIYCTRTPGGVTGPARTAIILDGMGRADLSQKILVGSLVKLVVSSSPVSKTGGGGGCCGGVILVLGGYRAQVLGTGNHVG